MGGCAVNVARAGRRCRLVGYLRCVGGMCGVGGERRERWRREMVEVKILGMKMGAGMGRWGRWDGDDSRGWEGR